MSNFSETEKQDWAAFIQNYQCDDGLFRDPAISNEMAETEDWWGWRHLTCHAITALTAIDRRAEKPFRMLEFLYRDGEVKNGGIKKALSKAYRWVLSNTNEDGGFVFRSGEPFIYGHKLMSSRADESAMFPTWFRILSLSYLNRVLHNPDLQKINWNSVDCPGYQFWRV